MSEQAVPILMYHSISHNAHPRFQRYTVAPEQFKQQMAFLASQHFRPITAARYVNVLAAGGPLETKPILITFDDAFLDFYTQALPVLADFGFPATLFVPTMYVGTTSRWLKNDGEADRPMLDWSRLDEIARLGVECGAHSHSHVELDRLDGSRAREEVSLCKHLLEERLGREVTSFSYPFGYYTGSLKAIVRQAGYTSACAVRHTLSYPGDDLFALRRVMVAREMDIAAFRRLVSRGGSRWTRAARDFRETAASCLRRRGLFPGSPGGAVIDKGAANG